MCSTLNPLETAIDQVGLMLLASHLQVSYQAVQKWLRKGRLPRTEWTGETRYAERIAVLTDNRVTKAQLLAPWKQVDYVAPDQPEKAEA